MASDKIDRLYEDWYGYVFQELADEDDSKVRVLRDVTRAAFMSGGATAEQRSDERQAKIDSRRRKVNCIWAAVFVVLGAVIHAWL